MANELTTPGTMHIHRFVGANKTRGKVNIHFSDATQPLEFGQKWSYRASVDDVGEAIAYWTVRLDAATCSAAEFKMGDEILQELLLARREVAERFNAYYQPGATVPAKKSNQPKKLPDGRKAKRLPKP